MKQFIFLMASERSGTNLLRLMMENHGRICAPSAPHFLHTLMPFQYLYDQNRRRLLVKHICDLLLMRSHGWKLTREEIIEHCLSRHLSFEETIAKIYELEADRNNKDTIFIKDNGVINYPFETAARFPRAKFVYLVRDSRDFTHSWLKSANHSNSTREAAFIWRTQQQQALNFMNCDSNEGRVCIIKYEDLLAQPSEQLKRLCKFCDVEFDNEMLRFNESNAAHEAAQSLADWVNLDKPLIKGNVNKYIGNMSLRKIKLIEGLTFSPMKTIGYDIKYAKKDIIRKPLPIPTSFNALFTIIRMLLQASVSTREIQNRIQRAQKLKVIRREARQLTDSDIVNDLVR